MTGIEEDLAVGSGLPRGWERLRGRLAATAASATARGWAGPLLVTALGAWLRFTNLATPRDIVFDEIYYAPQAFGILRYGAEHAVNSFTVGQIAGGKTTDIFLYGGEFSAHPPF